MFNPFEKNICQIGSLRMKINKIWNHPGRTYSICHLPLLRWDPGATQTFLHPRHGAIFLEWRVGTQIAVDDEDDDEEDDDGDDDDEHVYVVNFLYWRLPHLFLPPSPTQPPTWPGTGTPPGDREMFLATCFSFNFSFIMWKCWGLGIGIWGSGRLSLIWMMFWWTTFILFWSSYY